MLQINHHLTDALLERYSAGTLPEAFSLVVATHVSLCDECRARLGALDALGGAVLERTSAARLSDGALAATLARIARSGASGDDAKDPIAAAPSMADAVLPAPLRSYVGGDVGEVRWRPVGGGVRQAVLNTSSEASARLLCIPAGARVPDHGHRGTELTLVLQGAFSDAAGRFTRGDVEVATEADEHMPVAEAGADCICLAATDARLKFKTVLPRIAQPFIGI